MYYFTASKGLIFEDTTQQNWILGTFPSGYKCIIRAARIMVRAVQLRTHYTEHSRIACEGDTFIWIVIVQYFITHLILFLCIGSYTILSQSIWSLLFCLILLFYFLLFQSILFYCGWHLLFDTVSWLIQKATYMRIYYLQGKNGLLNLQIIIVNPDNFFDSGNFIFRMILRETNLVIV